MEVEKSDLAAEKCERWIFTSDVFVLLSTVVFAKQQVRNYTMCNSGAWSYSSSGEKECLGTNCVLIHSDSEVKVTKKRNKTKLVKVLLIIKSAVMPTMKSTMLIIMTSNENIHARKTYLMTNIINLTVTATQKQKVRAFTIIMRTTRRNKTDFLLRRIRMD